MQRLGVFETIVRVATRSDYIHVAIVPAPNVQLDHKGCVQRVAVHDIAFTAFMFLGYDEVYSFYFYFVAMAPNLFFFHFYRKVREAFYAMNTIIFSCP